MAIPLEVAAYMLPGDAKLERCRQRDGSYRWAIRRYGDCMNSDGEWEYEPQPSSRDDSFMDRCRFNSAEDAYTVFSKFGVLKHTR